MKYKVYVNGGVGLNTYSSMGGRLRGFMTLSETTTSEGFGARKEYTDFKFSDLNTNLITSGYLPLDTFLKLAGGDTKKNAINGKIELIDACTAGTYSVVTVNSKGVITTGRSITSSDLPVIDWGKITATPTTAGAYGITDAPLITGGSLTGNLELFDIPVDDTHAVTKTYTSSALSLLASNYISSGDIVLRDTAGTYTGFLRCNGAIVTKATYPVLYSIIGDAASPNGTPADKFGLPDLANIESEGHKYFIKV